MALCLFCRHPIDMVVNVVLDVAGHMVQDLWDGGRAREIHDYCRSDVLDTYFVYLRSRVVAGAISLADVQSVTVLQQPSEGKVLAMQEISAIQEISYQLSRKSQILISLAH